MSVQDTQLGDLEETLFIGSCKATNPNTQIQAKGSRFNI